MQEGEFDRQPFFYMTYMKVGPNQSYAGSPGSWIKKGEVWRGERPPKKKIYI